MDKTGDLKKNLVEAVAELECAKAKIAELELRLEINEQLVNAGSFQMDWDTMDVRWSRNNLRLFGVTPDEFGKNYKSITEFIHPDDRPSFDNAMAHVIATRADYAHTHRIIRPDGEVRHVRECATTLGGPEGKLFLGTTQDITELVQTREAEAELNAMVQLAGEVAQVGGWKLNFKTKKVEITPVTAGFLDRHELRSLSVQDAFAFFGPESLVRLQRSIARNIKTGQAIDEIVTLTSNTGIKRDVHVIGRSIRDSKANRVTGLRGAIQDITEQRARDQQLRLLEAATARLNDILLITESEPIDGVNGPKIVYVNNAFERRTGFTRAEAIGNTPRILQGPNTQRAELDRIRNALKNWEPVRAELINYTKSGDEFWLELDIVPLADEAGWYTHWVAVERDITERKLAEEALKANEERFRLATSAAGTAIWDWDVVADLKWWSEGLQEIFGHSVSKTNSKPKIQKENLHPDDIERFFAALERLVSGQDSFLEESYRFRRGDGTWAIVEDKAFAFRDDNGVTLRVLGSMTDVTEKRQLEERLRQSQKLEVVGQLTGGVAHDFNNLLTVILGNAEIMEEQLGAQPVLQELARMSLEAAERGAQLTSQLLAFSRKQPLEPKVIDVAQLIQGMDGLLRRTLQESIDIEIVSAGGLWSIEADAAQLESAILNLAVNARDAMPIGGCLTIEVANSNLDDDYVFVEPDLRPGQYVVIVVTDTGCGIPQDMLNKIFEPFFTSKEIGKGSGLGLSMVFGFVKQSGGHIRVYSELGEGTSFKLYFPRSRSDQKAVNGLVTLKIVGGSERILVVEDDRIVRDHVSMQLRALGYDVVEASAGKEAIEVLLQVQGIDLLFTDVVMPGGMGGRKLAEQARKIRPEIAILFTSGYTENSIVHEGRLDPGIKLLSKPYRREQLAAKIRDALEDQGSR